MLFFLSLMSIILSTGISQSQDKLNVLLITGGHAYDTIVFNTVFEQMNGIQIEKSIQPAGNKYIASGGAANYDVIVFYDSWQNISDEEKKGYENLLQKGVGMVFLHHSLVSYQNWDGFTEIIGGKYRHPRYYTDSTLISGFKHDISMTVLCNPDHPVTKDIGLFEIFDEGYSNIYVLPEVDVIMTTNHEHCHEIIGWTNEVMNSRVVYLLPGHGESGFNHPVYQQIIKNAIFWAAGD